MSALCGSDYKAVLKRLVFAFTHSYGEIPLPRKVVLNNAEKAS